MVDVPVVGEASEALVGVILWWGECGGIVGDGVVLPFRLVCVGKPACSHVCRLGVVGIDGSVFEHCSLGLSCPVSRPGFKHYKSLADTVAAKIELTKNTMCNKAEASSLSVKDKQRLQNIIVKKITPIEEQAD